MEEHRRDKYYGWDPRGQHHRPSNECRWATVLAFSQTLISGVKDFDWTLAWEAVRKDAFTPPERDTEVRQVARDWY